MILVTGGTGLVGSHLLLHLLENGETTIRAIYRNQKQIDKTKSLFEYYKKIDLIDNVEWIQADILDIPSLEIAFEKVDYVYHCAAKVSFNPKDENQLRKINIEGTANIVNFCIDKKVKKLCYVSSIAALGEISQNEKFINEESIWNPEKHHSDYAISKYGAEMEVWRGHQEGLQVVIVNPGVIFGPLFWKTSSGAFYTAIKKGIPFYTNGISGYVAVTDVVKIMHQLMQSDISGERFIIIAENRTYKDIIYTIANKIDAKKTTLQANAWLLKMAFVIDWIISFVFRTKRKLSKASIASLLNEDLISNEKVKDTLNYNFEKIDSYLDKIVVDFK